MTLNELIDNLNGDLSREYAHWHFYMNAALRVIGLHREEYSEFFLKEAAGEMKHIEEFGRLIIGLGGVPTTKPAAFRDDITDPYNLLVETLRIEEEVVEQFVNRQDESEELENNGGLDRVHGRRVNVFLDAQILDSRSTVDNVREMLKMTTSK